MKKKICFIVAVPGTANAFLRDHICALSELYDIYLAGNIKSKDEISQLNVNDFFRFDIQRNISLGNDIKAVWQLYKYFKRMKFDAVHSVTPKAGMTTAIAARLAGIKHRTHIFTGQVWCTRKGFMRWLLKLIDKVTSTLDNHILVDGESQRQYIIKNGVVSEKKSRVLGAGSISGVNTDRFVPNQETREQETEPSVLKKIENNWRTSARARGGAAQLLVDFCLSENLPCGGMKNLFAELLSAMETGLRPEEILACCRASGGTNLGYELYAAMKKRGLSAR